MAGIKLKKVSGASLIEVLTATVILVIILTISTFLFLRVTTSTYTLQKIKAELVLNSALIELKKNQKFFNEEWETESFSIEKNISKYRDAEDLLMIELKAFDKEGKLLVEKKEVFLTHAN
jgi:hypothetical protein